MNDILEVDSGGVGGVIGWRGRMKYEESYWCLV